MKKIILIILMCSIFVGCKKQTIDLDAKVQKKLLEVHHICRTTNVVPAILMINNLIEKKLNQGNFIFPNYAHKETFIIITNLYEPTELLNINSKSNNSDNLMALSLLYMFQEDLTNAYKFAYAAYYLDKNRMDILKQVLDTGISYKNKLEPSINKLLKKYNLQSTNELSKFTINFKFLINTKEFTKCEKLIKKFQKKHPEYKCMQYVANILLNIYSKKTDNKSFYEKCLFLYNNGYKDTWFGMCLGNKALKYQKYKIAADCYKMRINLLKKINEPVDEVTLVVYAFALNKKGDLIKAKEIINNVLKQNPTNELAITALKQME